jgi:DNA-binding winged helix-turn-helix (wHTH) protein
MKSFKAFRLDIANHFLFCNGERVPVAPKAFDVLAYLVEHVGQVVTQVSRGTLSRNSLWSLW